MRHDRLRRVATLMRRPSSAGAALLAALASAFAVALAVWGRSASGRIAAEALGTYCDLLLLGCSLVLCESIFFIILEDGRLGVLGNVTLTASLVWLVWLLGSASVRVPRNGLIGFRTRRTLADDATWRIVNAKHGRRLHRAAILGLAGVFTPPYGSLVALLPAVVVGLLFLAEETRTASPQ